MNNTWLMRFSRQNIVSDRIMTIPLVIATSLLWALYLVMHELAQNKNIIASFSQLPVLISMGSVIIIIFAVIFTFYALQFWMRYRMKALALYSVLGLEKKHFTRMLFFEYFMLAISTIVVSILFAIGTGNLFYLGLRKIMVKLPVMGQFSVHTQGILYLAMMVGAFYLVAFILNTTKLLIASPMELMRKSKKEKNNKILQIIFGIVGVAGIVIGYWMAITAPRDFTAIVRFFYAVLFVIIGTYGLFYAIIPLILRFLQKTNLYYKPVGFLSISGMKKRMNSNAIGLASIALLSTMLIVTLGTTTSMYHGIDQRVASYCPTTFKISYTLEGSEYQQEIINQYEQELTKKIQEILVEDEKLEDQSYEASYFTFLEGKENQYNLPTEEATMVDTAKFEFFIQNDKEQKRQNDEIVVSYSPLSDPVAKTMTIAGKEFKVVSQSQYDNEAYGMSAYRIYFANEKVASELVKELKDIGGRGHWSVSFAANVANKKDSFEERVRQIEQVDNSGDYESEIVAPNLSRAVTMLVTQENYEEGFYTIFGGLLFVGGSAGTAFLIGVFLIVYYKQMMEGLEDKRRFEIMRKVGLPEKLVKKTIHRQILWLFGIPILVAIIHCSVAYPILKSLVKLFGVASDAYLFKYMIVIGAIFSIVYIVFYALTSRLYYQEISEQ